MDCACGLDTLHRGFTVPYLYGSSNGGGINSTRFLVNNKYEVKLLDDIGVKYYRMRKEFNNVKEPTDNVFRYLSPEAAELSTCWTNNVMAEVYRLGLVFYEIAIDRYPLVHWTLITQKTSNVLVMV